MHSIWPIFNEDSGQSSSFSDYTIMDYIVADDILSRNPSHHFDIGSRIDGVILQLAHSIDVVVLDVRPNPSLTRFGVQTVLGNAPASTFTMFKYKMPLSILDWEDMRPNRSFGTHRFAPID